MNIRNLTLLALGFLLMNATQANDVSKLISKRWKLIKETEGGKEIKPKHEKLVIEFNKKGEFVVEAAYEETHRGTYKVAADGKSIILNDEISKEEKTLSIERVDKHHLNLGEFDGATTIIEMQPAKKNEDHLTNRELLIVNTWHCYKSDEPTNVDLVIEFHKDHSYVIIPAGYKIPTAVGDWKLDPNDNSKIVLDSKDEKHLEIEIIGEIETHTIVLKNSGEEGITNHFRDQELWKKYGVSEIKE